MVRLTADDKSDPPFMIFLGNDGDVAGLANSLGIIPIAEKQCPLI
jgi:hypothetical protein